MDNTLSQPNRLALLRGEAAFLSPEETDWLRRLPDKCCMVTARWSSLEPKQGVFDEEELSLLREGLIRLLSAGIEPVLCLCAGDEPEWFTAMGGWGQEDNLRCYLRYVGRLVRSAGHLAERYITFAPANELGWQGKSSRQNANRMSNIACAHIRAYRFIHDLRKDRGWENTSVGFGLRMYPEKLLRRGVLSPAHVPLPFYQTEPLKAMGKGDFNLPLWNVLRVHRGDWTDFVAVTVPGEESRRDILDCCARADEELHVPVWLLDEI